VFKRLNRVVVTLFYQQANFKKWKGFRVLAVDGSTLALPGNHTSLKKIFTYYKFGPKADAGHWMSRISYLYDVFNGLVIDAQMKSYRTSESTLCKLHMPFVKKGDLLLFDRYYASLERMFLLQAKGVHFLFRMKDNWWKCVEKFVQSELDEQIVDILLPSIHQHLLKKYPHLTKVIKIRLIKKKNRKGEVQVFATSLLDEKTYSKKAILNLYKQRWSIEEAYKMIKCRLEVADFSGLTAWAIQQDFFAKTLLITLCNALCFGIQPKLPKRQPVKRGMEKRVPIINRTYAMKQVINMLTKVTFSLDSFSEWFRRFSIKISKQVEYSPRNQSNKRKFKSNSKYSMAYKNL
ncbi:MAG: IS4 family transposase, partial [Bacteroidota bacterium]